ncbi:MAG: TonB family protein [Bacteroidota bacterium]
MIKDFKPLLVLLLFLSHQILAQEDIYTIVDKQPEFPGGLSAFYQYVKKHLEYPEVGKAAKVEGRVFVQFVVETDGMVSGVRTIKGMGPRYDSEAERLVRDAPQFTPGQNDGKPVRVRLILPIAFKLENREIEELNAAPEEEYIPPAKSVREAIDHPDNEQLSLEFQDLITLDPDITKASQLIYLNLSGNKLQKLPEDIGNLQQLEELFITYNQLRTLPASFSRLESLRTLYLDRNQISDFPLEILELPLLETLDLSFTNIKLIPMQVADMPNLKIIYARGTGISRAQIEAIRKINPQLEILK